MFALNQFDGKGFDLQESEMSTVKNSSMPCFPSQLSHVNFDIQNQKESGIF